MKNIKLGFIITVITIVITSCRSVPQNILDSPQYKDGKFRNTISRENDRTFFGLVKFLFFEERQVWPEWIENKTKPQLKTSNNENVITFINHATFLAEVGNKRLLFDPIFSKTAGPTSWLGVKRHRNPALPIEDLPHIDYVFISHNHYDHLDLPTLTFLSKRDNPLIFVPLGDKYWLDDNGIKNVIELDWWQKYKINKCFNVNFVPAQHSSARTPFDRDKSLWGGYVIEYPNLNLFHAGDTGYSPHFKEIGAKFKIDLAMLPIGDYEPSWFLEYVHMNPKQALSAHIDLKSRQSLAMHSETFPLSTLGFKEAEQEFESALAGLNLNKPFNVLDVGQSLKLVASSQCS